jgi:hypothetical protein
MSAELHMLPVRAGDATLLIDRGPDRPFTVLIDAGLAGDEVASYLQGIGVFRLDLVVLSHPDLDHIRGLRSVVANPMFSIGEIWCFDLTFLRGFVAAGVLPGPQQADHQILYAVLMQSLVAQQEILISAQKRGIRCFQVCEGRRANFGRFHLEVLYPWDGFYRLLRSPAALKKLLAKRWPQDWTPPEGAGPTAHPADIGEQKLVLEELLRGLEVPEPGHRPLANPGADYPDLPDEVPAEKKGETFPLPLIGTLYNNLSIVVLVHVTGGRDGPRLLFPGDLSDWTQLVLRRPFDLRADVFKYPHHGSLGVGVNEGAIRDAALCCAPCWPCPHCAPWAGPRACAAVLWHGLLLGRRSGADLFCEVVKPSHTLIFPYPQPNLPAQGALKACLGHLHANRRDQAPGELAKKDNEVMARVLAIGEERNDISVK